MTFIKAADLAPSSVGITSTSIILMAAAFLLLLLISSFLYIVPAYSDGLFQDQISASVGERKVGLFIKMTPQVIST